MTREDRFIGQLEEYLDTYEGITSLPDAVRGAIRAKLPKTKQVGSTAGPKRFLNMTISASAPLRYGLVAVVVLAAALLGGAYLMSRGNLGNETDASPSPSSGPGSLLDATWVGTVPAGDYALDHPAFPATIEFAVPAGWFYWTDKDSTRDSTVQTLLVDSLDTGAANGSGWGISFTVVDEVRVDPCNASPGAMDPSVTESAASLAAAFSQWPGFPATTVEDVTVSGYSGKRVDITRDDDSGCAPVVFTTPSGYQFGLNFSTSEPLVNQFTLLDVEGSVLVIWTTDYPGTSVFEDNGGASPDPRAHVEDQAELAAIFDSIVITPR